jgi:hypothetical protein
VVALGLFAVVERRAAEPVLPPALFRNRVFSVTSAVGFVVGFALFGALTYLPLFQQIVRGQSPTSSGLQLFPVMGGLLLSSTLSGQLISKTGRYKVFPVIGTAVAAVGLFLLTQLDAHTTTLDAALRMLVLGLGLGFVMQVLVLAVQNAVEFRVMGVATSGSILFRQIGGSIGLAIFGAIFSNSLRTKIAADLPAGAKLPKTISPAAVNKLPKGLHDAYVQAVAASLHPVFVSASVIAIAAFLLTWLLRDVPLRTSSRATAGSELAGAASEETSLRV